MTTSDREAISHVIDRMYEALCWAPDRAPDWEAFRSVFLEDASLFPSARPVSVSALEPFIERMSGLRDAGEIETFDEEKFKDSIFVFGNIAVAFSSYASRVNNGSQNQGVNALLLVKEGETWRCAAMAWENAGEGKPIPAEFLPGA